eukprot:gene26325-32891_t
MTDLGFLVMIAWVCLEMIVWDYREMTDWVYLATIDLVSLATIELELGGVMIGSDFLVTTDSECQAMTDLVSRVTIELAQSGATIVWACLETTESVRFGATTVTDCRVTIERALGGATTEWGCQAMTGLPGDDRLGLPGDDRLGLPGDDRLGMPGDDRIGLPGDDRLGTRGDDRLFGDASAKERKKRKKQRRAERKKRQRERAERERKGSSKRNSLRGEHSTTKTIEHSHISTQPSVPPPHLLASSFSVVESVDVSSGMAVLAKDVLGLSSIIATSHTLTGGGQKLDLMVLEFEHASLDFVSPGATRSASASTKGQVLPETTLVWKKPEGSATQIIFTGQESGTARNDSLFRSDFNFEQMGIGGLDEPFKKMFRTAFASRIFPGLVKQLGINHIRGILLYGPPGCGKTLIARQIGKVLNSREPKIINGPEVLDKFVGGSEEKIRALFADAEKDQLEM